MDTIQGRYTPWDTAALKLKTYELLVINIDENNTQKLTEIFQKNSFCDAELIYGRFPANNFNIKNLLLKAGYIPCETSHKVSLTKLQNYTLPPLFSRRIIPISLIEKKQLNEIAALALTMFNFSRFHEDPFIKKENADFRMSQWVTDMMTQDVHTLVSKNTKNQILSFMIYTKNSKNEVELLLGGSKKGHELHSPWFWGSVLAYLKEKKCTKITTTISAANTGVISLYQSLGFKIIKSNIDYHKHISNSI